jgi:hypothetical protein
MNAQKKMNLPRKCELELLAGGGSIERVPPKAWLKLIFGFLFSKKSDLTLEGWEALEAKPKVSRTMQAPLRDQHHHQMRWHL